MVSVNRRYVYVGLVSVVVLLSLVVRRTLDGAPESGGLADEAETKAIEAVEAARGLIMRDRDFEANHVFGVSFGLGCPPTILKELKAFRHLKSLTITSARVTEAALNEIAELDSISVLWLSDTELDDSGLKKLRKLRNLRSLDIGRNPKITDAGLQSLKDLRNLRVLLIRETGVTDDGIAALQAAMPRLGIVREKGSSPAAVRRMVEDIDRKYAGVDAPQFTAEESRILQVHAGLRQAE